MDDLYDETFPIPRAVKFPVELHPPLGFNPAEVGTWPRVHGRLEYVGGKLLYMPPCGELQSSTVADVVFALVTWTRAFPGFMLGTNEAGMILGEDVRGADAAIWRRADLPPLHGGFHRVPPVLAVEVAGRDDTESVLRDKAAWYLAHGVTTVWLVLPATREVVVITQGAETRHGGEERLPAPSGLDELEPRAAEMFVQISQK